MTGDAVLDAWPVGTLMARLDRHHRAALVRLGVRREADSGKVLLREGSVGDHVILIHRGLAKVSSTTPDGHNALLAIRASGDLIGEMAGLDGSPRSATVTTCGTCTYRVINQRDFRRFLADHPEAMMRLAGMVADRLRWSNEFRVDFGSYPARVRLARVIVKLTQAYGQRTDSGLIIAVPLTQPELASLCGAAEITVQKLLHDFRRRRLISTGYRRIAVLDLPGLWSVGRLHGLRDRSVAPSGVAAPRRGG